MAGRTAAVVRAVAAAPGPVLYHCQGGRDRTGLLTILLLALAGVPAEVIVEDRFRTAPATADPPGAEVERATAEAHYAAAGTTGEAVVAGLLADLDVDDYLRAAGVEAGVLAGLRDRLVIR
jgi:hypothetical protein